MNTTDEGQQPDKDSDYVSMSLSSDVNDCNSSDSDNETIEAGNCSVADYCYYIITLSMFMFRVPVEG